MVEGVTVQVVEMQFISIRCIGSVVTYRQCFSFPERPCRRSRAFVVLPVFARRPQSIFIRDRIPGVDARPE